MASPSAPAPTQRRPRVRKSIAAMPSSDGAQDSEALKQFAISGGASTQLKSNSGSKKSRSKSMGPGGLDALKETSGNRRKSSNAFQPKSILKPTIPLSPIQDIPARKSPRSGSGVSKVARSPLKQHSDADHVDTVPDTPARGAEASGGSKGSNASTGEQSGARETADDTQEAEERRKRKAEIQKQREARRKSMAGRRVSFAPEATLHTWDTEVLQDSTTSTGSADSTRRASSFSQSANAHPNTPPEQLNGDAAGSSPEHQRDAHKKKRRRSSGIPPMNFNDPDVLSSSPFSGDSAVGDDVEINASPSPKKGDNATLGDASMQSIEEATQGDQDLDASLEDAAKRAGTRTMNMDESGDVSMEIVGDDVTAAFKPWVKQSMGTGSPHPGKAIASMDQENVNLFSATAAADRGSPTPSNMGEEDMSMDMTQAMGGILRGGGQSTIPDQPGERYPRRRQSVRKRRRSSGASSELGDGTMELTTAVGGIHKMNGLQDVDSTQVDENEELSMEFTSVFDGGLKKGSSLAHTQDKPPSPKNLSSSSANKQDSAEDADEASNDEDSDMEMTEAFGSIEPAQPEQQPAVAETSVPSRPESRAGHRHEEVESASSALRNKSAAKSRPSVGATTAGSPVADPFARRDRLRRSGNEPLTATPERKPATPTKQLTPNPTNERPTTPGKTPPPANVAMRKTTPKKLFKEEIKASRSPLNAMPSLFRRDTDDGPLTPSVVLAPKSASARKRPDTHVSEQSGSPQIAAILDRRTSLSDNADVFAPKGAARGVQFEDPRLMEAEVTKEREEDSRRESGQFIMEQEADGGAEDENATQSLKEMMQSMTPKKNNKLKGRKSLAAGSAKGLLGKRPAELDDSEEEGSPRTFGKSSSPLKKIRLQGPPSAEQTMRSSRTGHGPLTAVSENVRPRTPNTQASPGQKQVTTPKSQGRFKDADQLPSAQKPVPTMGQTAPSDAERISKDNAEENIGLNDFLNLTNIRFMELNTTKRRPTVAPSTFANSQHDGASETQDASKQFEDAVVAGACTIPMLELFQHSCRELKKYISEGRSVVREIESETLDENPPIFKEYTTATPTQRAALDNQFKNMKTNARLLSKATWYEWRMKLLEGLQESLKETTQGLALDDEALRKQTTVIQEALNAAQQQRQSLEQERQILRTRADELASHDPEDLELARQRLETVNSEITSYSHKLESTLEAVADIDTTIINTRHAKSVASSHTKTAQTQLEQSRGWSATEVQAVEKRVAQLQQESGWQITGAQGTVLTLSYKKEVLLRVNPTAFGASAEGDVDTELSLTYAMEGEPSTTQRFFLQLLRAHLHSLDPRGVKVGLLLKAVKDGWELAGRIGEEIQMLERRGGVTTVNIVGDDRLRVETNILVPNVLGKVVLGVEVVVSASGGGVAGGNSAVDARAHGGVHVAYENEKGILATKQTEMEKGVQKLVKGTVESEESLGWASAAGGLKVWLVKCTRGC